MSHCPAFKGVLKHFETPFEGRIPQKKLDAIAENRDDFADGDSAPVNLIGQPGLPLLATITKPRAPSDSGDDRERDTRKLSRSYGH